LRGEANRRYGDNHHCLFPGNPMAVFDYLIPIALGAVLVVLLMGLWNMMRGGSSSRSQTLMRWRVGLQFVAVLIIMATFYLGTQ